MLVWTNISLQDPAFNFLDVHPEVALLDGSSIFNILRNRHTVLYSGRSILHSHQQCTNVPTSPHPCQHLLISGLFNSSCPDGCDVVSYWGFGAHFPNDYWSRASFHLLIVHFSFFFFFLSVRSSLYILDINFLSDIWVANIFSHSVGSLYILLIVSFDGQKH